MHALTYHGSHDVRVDTVPDPILQEPDDIILKITATAICGSDLHLYRGKMPGLKDGDILGHEFMGVVVDAGSGGDGLKRVIGWWFRSLLLVANVSFARDSYFRHARPQIRIAAQS